MKRIITLLIFVFFFHSGSSAQEKAPRAVMKKTDGKTVVKKPSAKKEVAPLKKKENKPLPEKKKEAENTVHEKEKEKVIPSDSVKVPEDVVQVSDSQLIMPATEDNADVQPAKAVFLATSADKPEKDWSFWMLWLSPVLILGMGVYVFRTNGIIYEKVRRIQKHLDSQKNDVVWERTKVQGGVSRAIVEELINTNPTLRMIQEECNALRSNMEKLEQPAPKMIPSVPVEESIGNTFYMTGPTNNYFPSSARSNHRENTVYKFILQPGGNEARFELHTTGASISEIIKVIESYIKPACDEENLPSPNIRNIVTRKQGIAILDNEKWIIKDKALIRYE